MNKFTFKKFVVVEVAVLRGKGMRANINLPVFNFAYKKRVVIS